MVLGYQSEEVNFFLYKALATLSMDLGMEELLPVVLETGKVNLTCMELLDRANTETYGIPKPTEVSLKVEKRPFIVVTGHDLRDLKLLLEQTEGKGINIYTHGEMLPAHAYPELKKIRSSERKLRNGMAEPAERICRSSGSHPVYDQLPDATEGELRRPRLFHGSSFLSGCGTCR